MRLNFLILLLISVSVSAQKTALRDSFPVFPDLVYEYRFAQLQKTSAIDLEFSPQVKKYIEIFTLQRRNDISRILGLKTMYFPIFEEYLDKHELPLELKYLPVLESGLNPLARSASGAVGLWQFLYHSAAMFDLQINSFVDERCDVYKSTEAACKYLKYLHQTYSNWNLVLSSYNGGPGVVRNAIERSGGKVTYSEISTWFSEETRNYVPAFTALIYVLNYADEHGIKPLTPSYSFSELDTVQVKYNLQFQKLSEVTELPVETIRYLNPVYKLDVIPETGNSQNLVLPKNKMSIYLKNENILFANSLSNARIPVLQTPKQKIVYTIKKGDFLHKVALKYGCSLEDIKTWNSLKSDSVYIGQNLVIWQEKKPKEPSLVHYSD